jgi:hypothetical protein
VLRFGLAGSHCGEHGCCPAWGRPGRCAGDERVPSGGSGSTGRGPPGRDTRRHRHARRG